MSFSDLVSRTAAVFVGTVTEVDVAAGRGMEPRTLVRMRVDDTWAGFVPSELEFRQPEGVLADGRFLHAPEAPKFTVGESYVIFYKSGPWILSPIAGGSAGYLRLSTIAGRAVLLSNDGRGVTALTDEGFLSGPKLAPSAAQLDLDARSDHAHAIPTPAQEILAQTCMSAASLENRVRIALATAKLAAGDLQFEPTVVRAAEAAK